MNIYIYIYIQVNFDELVAQSEAVRRRQQEREARQAAMLQQRVSDIKQEMNGQHFVSSYSSMCYCCVLKLPTQICVLISRIVLHKWSLVSIS